MIEEQGDLTSGVEGTYLVRPEGELPPKFGNKKGFGLQVKSKSVAGGNDKKVKKVKASTDYEEDADVEDEGDDNSDLKDRVVENNRGKVVSTAGEDDEDEEEDEPPAKRRKTQTHRSKKR